MMILWAGGSRFLWEKFYIDFGKLEIRACLKIEEVPDFCSKMVSFKEKTAGQTDVCRGFLT